MNGYQFIKTWLASSIAALCLATSAQAENYPSRPIKIVVPFAPGGSTDIIARMLGQRMSVSMGQPVIIENKPGATGIIGVESAAKAPADGHTLLVTTSGSLMGTKFMYEKLPFNVESDLRLTYQISQLPAVLVVNSSLPVNTVPQLLHYVAANRGRLVYGSWGLGTYAHLGGAYMDASQKGEMVHSIYKGEAITMQEVLAGRVNITFISASIAAPHIMAGAVKALAVTSAKRTPSLPNVPTMLEQGVTDLGYQMNGWIGLAVPAKTPAFIVNRLAEETRKAISQPDFQSRLADMGMEAIPDSSPDAFTAVYQRDLPNWGRLIRQAGIKPQ